MSDTKHPGGLVLQAHHDGELSPPFAAEVVDHCENCAVCRADLAELERVRRLLEGAPARELARTVWPRVRPNRRRANRLRPAFAFAATAAGVVVGILAGPIRFSGEEAVGDLAWAETVTVWNGGETSSLLAVYRADQD